VIVWSYGSYGRINIYNIPVIMGENQTRVVTHLLGNLKILCVEKIWKKKFRQQ
jgi:hypothetical protein